MRTNGSGGWMNKNRLGIVSFHVNCRMFAVSRMMGGASTEVLWAFGRLEQVANRASAVKGKLSGDQGHGPGQRGGLGSRERAAER